MTTEHVKFKTPGHLIKQAREAQEITLVQLSSDTRIPVNLLEALEDDDYDQISGAVYVRSFLKTCAMHLELEPTVLIELFERMSSEDSTLEVPAEQTWESESNVHRISTLPKINWKLYGSIGAVIIVIVITVILLKSGGKQTSTPVPSPGPVNEEQPTVSAPAENVEVSELTEEPADLDSMLPVGDNRLEFSDGNKYPVVIRLIYNNKVEDEIGLDSSNTRKLNWDNTSRALPDAGVEAGKCYKKGGKYIFYYGAANEFYLVFRDRENVQVRINGQDKQLPGRNLGGECLLTK